MYIVYNQHSFCPSGMFSLAKICISCIREISVTSCFQVWWFMKLILLKIDTNTAKATLTEEPDWSIIPTKELFSASWIGVSEQLKISTIFWLIDGDFSNIKLFGLGSGLVFIILYYLVCFDWLDLVYPFNVELFSAPWVLGSFKVWLLE